MVEKHRIARVVRVTLADLTGVSAEAIRAEDRLVEDLKVTSDDLSFVFVPEVERQLGLRVRTERWRSVHTTQDAIDLLYETLAERPI